MLREVALVVGDADNGLRERLDKEISAFNAAATGYADGRLLCIAVRDDSGDLLAGLFGWTWGGCGYIDFPPIYPWATPCVRPLTWCQETEATAARNAGCSCRWRSRSSPGRMSAWNWLQL